MRTLDDVLARDAALTVSCNYCGAREGDRCTTKPDRHGERHLLQNLPAHPARVKRAERIARLRQLDAQRAEALR